MIYIFFFLFRLQQQSLTYPTHTTGVTTLVVVAPLVVATTLVVAPTMVSGRVPANLLGAGTKRLTHVPNPVPAMNIVFKAGATVAATNSL